MNLRFRAFIVWLMACFRSKLRIDQDWNVVRFTVLPTDVELSGMNNGRFFHFMDIARLDLVTRFGFVKYAFKTKITTLIGTQFIRYKKVLKIFSRFDVESKYIYWDEKWWYLEHRFVQNGAVAAVGYVKCMNIGPDGKRSPQDVLKDIGMDVPSPKRPEIIDVFDKMDKDTRLLFP